MYPHHQRAKPGAREPEREAPEFEGKPFLLIHQIQTENSRGNLKHREKALEDLKTIFQAKENLNKQTKKDDRRKLIEEKQRYLESVFENKLIDFNKVVNYLD